MSRCRGFVSQDGWTSWLILFDSRRVHLTQQNDINRVKPNVPDFVRQWNNPTPSVYGYKRCASEQTSSGMMMVTTKSTFNIRISYGTPCKKRISRLFGAQCDRREIIPKCVRQIRTAITKYSTNWNERAILVHVVHGCCDVHALARYLSLKRKFFLIVTYTT